MNIIRNDKFIKRNKTIGQICTYGSLIILIIGLVLAFGGDISRILWSYAALIVGFILSQIGMYFTNRFGRNPRFDEIFATALEKLRREYTFYVYTSPIPMLLVGPCHIWVPIPLTARGKISYINGKWKQQGGNFLMKVFGQEGIGKPDREALADEAVIRSFLASKGIPEEEQPPINHVLVVLMKNTQIGDVSEAPIPLVDLPELKRYIRRIDRESCEKPLSEEQLEQINAALSEFGTKS
ncbi:MAG TPA: hypothetical protein DCG78_05080 [Anaerolineaceae bacterium]|jgi:hypothetical protein|nr:MAG: hypothetical protein XD89_0317 [Anaerolineae bacterium 49_20]HAE85866.1 hypothetical protein [Anaerolineaceae bacterium]